jgi:hypothetical protein
MGTTTAAAKKEPPRKKAAAKPLQKPGSSDHTLEISIGNLAREYRQRLNMTVAGLARIAGLSPSMLSRIMLCVISSPKQPER